MNPIASGEKLVTSHHANVDAFHSVATLALDGVERVFGLTMDLVRSTVEDGTSVMHSVLTVETADRGIRLQSDYARAHTERTIAYLRNLSELSGNAQRDLAQVTQRWFGEQQAMFASAVEAGAQSVTADPKAVMAAIGAAASASKALYERVRQAGVPLPPEEHGDVAPKTAGKSTSSRKTRTATEGES